MNQRPASVRARFDREIGNGSIAYVSSVTVFELWYGVSKSQRRDFNARILAGFLSGPISLLPFEGEDAPFAGALRAELESIGRPVGAYDLLIAGQALRHEVILVTANLREFGRIRKLELEDWSQR
jgi:tRNA(fMet)-specific endonuclease VapC